MLCVLDFVFLKGHLPSPSGEMKIDGGRKVAKGV